MTQAQLASHVRHHGHHVTQSYISRVESGELDPPISVVRSIARALGVQPWQLLARPTDNVRFWDDYLHLSPAQKREVQRIIAWKAQRRS